MKNQRKLVAPRTTHPDFISKYVGGGYWNDLENVRFEDWDFALRHWGNVGTTAAPEESSKASWGLIKIINKEVPVREIIDSIDWEHVRTYHSTVIPCFAASDLVELYEEAKLKWKESHSSNT